MGIIATDEPGNAGMDGVQEQFRKGDGVTDKLRGWESDLYMLCKAIDACDPKSELLIRVNDVLSEVRAAILSATKECRKFAGVAITALGRAALEDTRHAD